MCNKVTLIGKVVFDPENKTKKHISQGEWKRIAMVFIDGEVTDYYSWFIQKRFNLTLNKPLRNAHISFINDSNHDMMKNGRTLQQVNADWERTKHKWHGKEIPIMLNLNVRTDGRSWWLNVDPEYRDLLHGIRNEVGLGRPFFGLHMSLGYANERWIAHSEYIHELFKTKLIS